MRGIRVGTVLGVVLALVIGATAAHAVWAVRRSPPVAATVTGDLTATAVWSTGAAPTLASPFPTQTVTTGTNMLRVTGGGAGTTLRWRLLVASSVAPAFQPYVTVQAYVGACNAPTPLPIPAGGYSPAGGYAPGTTVDVCVAFTLAANAPTSLQGQSLQPVVTATVQQRGT